MAANNPEYLAHRQGLSHKGAEALMLKAESPKPGDPYSHRRVFDPETFTWEYHPVPIMWDRRLLSDQRGKVLNDKRSPLVWVIRCRHSGLALWAMRWDVEFDVQRTVHRFAQAHGNSVTDCEIERRVV